MQITIKKVTNAVLIWSLSLLIPLFTSLSVNAATTVAGPAAGDPCDRTCLRGFIDQYLEALVAQDPSQLNVSENVKFTEDTRELNLGEGLWTSINGLGKYQVYLEDSFSNVASFYGVVIENDKPIYLALRLLIKNDEIIEIETIISRQGLGTPLPDELASRPTKPTWNEILKPSERVSRQEMIVAANQYFQGMELNTGEVIPFDESCNRTENGVQTTNNPDLLPPGAESTDDIGDQSCKGQFNSGGINIYSTPERRFWMADEERGVVIGFFMFNIVQAGAAVPIVEAFKIKNGRIYEIEAVMALGDFKVGDKSGW